MLLSLEYFVKEKDYECRNKSFLNILYIIFCDTVK